MGRISKTQLISKTPIISRTINPIIDKVIRVGIKGIIRTKRVRHQFKIIPHNQGRIIRLRIICPR